MLLSADEKAVRPASVEQDIAVDPFQPLRWIPLFSEETPATQFITFPRFFIEHLSKGQVYGSPSGPPAPLEIEWSDDTVETLPASSRQYNTSGVEEAIQLAIEQLDADVTPKLDTVCPTDATWANFHCSTRCSSPEEVLTLLKSSERVLEALVPSRPANIALRKWIDMDQRMEFRLSIKNVTLVAVSHRASDGMLHFSDSDADTIVRRISNWFFSRIRPRLRGQLITSLTCASLSHLLCSLILHHGVARRTRCSSNGMNLTARSGCRI